MSTYVCTCTSVYLYHAQEQVAASRLQVELKANAVSLRSLTEVGDSSTSSCGVQCGEGWFFLASRNRL